MVREVKRNKRDEELLSKSPSASRTPTPTQPGWSGEAFITDWIRKDHAENSVEGIILIFFQCLYEQSEDLIDTYCYLFIIIEVIPLCRVHVVVLI